MNKSTILPLLKKYQLQLACLIVIIFVFVLAIKLLIPNLQRLNQLHGSNLELKAKISALRQKDEQLSVLSEEELKSVFPKIIKVLPSSKDYVSLFTTFDQLQSKTGVAILRTDFQFGNISEKPENIKSDFKVSTKTVPITISVLGELEKITLFMNSLADLSGRLILVDNIQLEKKEQNLVEATIVGTAYYNPQPFTIGSIESSLPQLTRDSDKIMSQIGAIEAPVDDIGLTQDIQVGNNTLFY